MNDEEIMSQGISSREQSQLKVPRPLTSNIDRYNAIPGKNVEIPERLGARWRPDEVSPVESSRNETRTACFPGNCMLSEWKERTEHRKGNQWVGNNDRQPFELLNDSFDRMERFSSNTAVQNNDL